MKNALFILTIFLGLTGFSQNQAECNQLPYAKVDAKAESVGNLNDVIASSLPSSLAEDGTHETVFKMYVDCFGNAAKIKIEKTNLDDADSKWLWNVMLNSEWTPATAMKKNVTSTIFVTVKITNGVVEATVQ